MKANGGTAEGSGLGDMYDSLVSHLTPTHAIFLQKWERLIDLEAKHVEVVWLACYILLESLMTIFNFIISPCRLQRRRAGSLTAPGMTAIPILYQPWFLIIQINHQRENFPRATDLFTDLYLLDTLCLMLNNQITVQYVLPLP